MRKFFIGKIPIFVLFAVLLNPFVSVANAQTVVSPNNDKLSINFVDGKNKLLVAGTINGLMTNLSFNKASLTLDKNIIADQVTKPRTIAHWDRYESFSAYRVQAGSGRDSANFEINNSWLPSGQSGSDATWLNQVGPFMLIGAIKTSEENFTYHNLGLYWYQNNNLLSAGANPNVVKPTDTNAKFMRIWKNYTFESALKDGHYKTRLIALNNYLQNSGAGLEIAVRDIMSGTGLEDSCLQLELAWFSLQQMVRDFFIPTPDATNPSVNPNWSNKRDTWWERWSSGESTRNVLRAGMKQAASTMGNPAITTFVDLTEEGADQFGITNDGATNAVAISDKAEQIKELIKQIKSSSEAPLSGGNADWKCGTVVNISTFKWNKDLNAPAITDLDKLTEAVDKLVEQFKAFKENMDAPVGEQSECDKITEGNSIMLLIKKAICATMEVLKDWADGFFLWAKDWMEKSMGTYKGESIETPTNVPGTGDVLMSGGSSDSSGAQSGESGSSSSITSSVNLASSSIKIDNSAKGDIVKELESGGQISAKLFTADNNFKPNPAKGTIANIGIADPSGNPKITIKTQVPISSYNDVSKFVVLFPANGTNYQVQVLKNGENYNITDAGVQKYIGNIPELTSGQNENSEETTAYKFKLLGYVAPSDNANMSKYTAKYKDLQTAYNKNKSAVKIMYGTSSSNLTNEGKIEIYEWNDNEKKIKMKILGQNQFPTPSNTGVVKISWNNNSISFSIKSTDINIENYDTTYWAQ